MKEPQLLEFDIKGDERGSLIALEAQRSIPFEIKRVYYIFGTQPDVVRGRTRIGNCSRLLSVSAVPASS